MNLRTYALAATAAALLLGMIGWTGYTNLQTPLEIAAKDQAELTKLEESLSELSEHEQNATAIRDWNSETPNLLVHLQQLSKSIRPQQLKDGNFPAEQDVVLEKFSLEKRELTIDALARNDQAVQPFELRLRKSAYSPRRGKSNASKSVPKYPWQFKSIIEITEESDASADSASTASDKEPSA